MKTYDFFSKIRPARRRYALKFFLGALPVVVIALAELIVFYLMFNRVIILPFRLAIFAGSGLLVVAVMLMYHIFSKLISPVHIAQLALDNYIQSNELPRLPVEYEDEAGTLLSSIQNTLGQLDRLLGEKNDVIDLLSHDLRSPVARIQSLSYLIKNDEKDKNVYADYIMNECKGLLRMLENILLMLKEDSLAFILQNVNLRQLMLDTIRFFDFAIAEKELKLKIDIDDSLVIHVQQDLFTQAVRNIIGNAIKFSVPGKTITISGKQMLNQVSITVQDEGLGFNQADIQKIFDRFTTAGKKGTRGESTVGLGLYLSKKIIEKHNGTLMAESDGLNKGASFTIILHQLITKKPQDKMIKKPKMRLKSVNSEQ